MKRLLILLLSLLAIYSVAQPIEYNYICPMPDSRYLNPEQNIILKTGYPYDPVSIHDAWVSMKGSISGHFIATMSLSQDLKTLFIHHNKKFSLGENIHVFVSHGLRTLDGKNIQSIGFEFTIREQNLLPLLNLYYDSQQEEVQQVDVRSTGLATEYSGRDNNLPPDYPGPVNVYTAEGVSPGYTFFTPSVRMTPQYSEYLTIWDNYGIPIYYQKRGYTVFDLKVIDDGILAYAKGANQNAALKRYYLMDSKYFIVDSVLAGNGYYIDNHDMQLLDNGHYLIIIYDPQVVDMSQIVPGGNPAAIVTGLVLQEVDNMQNVYFQWRSWDHFEITDATDDINLLAYQIDYVHANAIDIDMDGHILLSSRHLDEITKINFSTGDVIWRFGKNSKNNEFTIINDPVGFSHQHDIRRNPSGTYSIFDNGNLHTPQISRGMEYTINEEDMTASLVWDYIHTPAIYASSTGSMRRLANNNALVGWGGSTPIALTEVTQNNQIVYEVELPANVAGYRALKYPWNTTAFTAQDNIDFGNYQGSNPKEYLLQITNNYPTVIQINSVHNHHSEYFSVGNLPLTIQPNSAVQLKVYFDPGQEGNYDDILTLNYDNAGNTRRIARQVKLVGLNEPDLPYVSFDPENLSVEVDPYTEIIATFSEPVKKVFGQEIEDADVPNLFVLKKSNLFGNNIPFHGTVSDDKTIITLIPDEPLDGNQQYFVQQLANKLADYQGNIIDYSDYSFFTTGDLVGYPEAKGHEDVRVYPNPLNDVLTVTSDRGKINRVEVFSIDGKIIFSDSFDQQQVRISSVTFPCGLLTVRVFTSEGEVSSTRLVRIDP